MQKVILGLILLVQAGLLQAQTPLVSTEWLANNLHNKHIVLIDMSDGFQYQRFHIPGAINLPYGYLNTDLKGVSLSAGQSQIIKILSQIGVTQDSYVIAYDDTGGLNAARLLWELDQLGHPQKAMLNGGLVKWIREGRKVSYQAPPIKPVTYRAKLTGSSATANLTNVEQANRNGKTLLLDVRSEEEYLGNPRFPRSGHIPGAKWWEWDQAVNFDGDFTIKKAEQLKTSLAKLGLTDQQQSVIVYCHSGHRASHAWFTLRELGFKNVRVYDGSMKEYEQHKDLPLKMGRQP